MTLNRFIELIYLIIWAACIPLLPYTFFRHRKHFETVFAVFVMLSITVLMALTREWVPGN